MDKIQDKLKKLPELPGVYIMKDSIGNIIYVGKSKALKFRVRQYFGSHTGHNDKVRAMVENIDDFEYIVTDSELEALVLECNLIKKHKPRYNILLKDNKQYPYIKLTLNEEYPCLTIARKVDKDGSRYFGPYLGGAVRETIDTLKKIFKVRSCKKNFPRDIGKERPCLNYHIGLCNAPCQGKISKDEYRQIFNEIVQFLEGKQDTLLEKLQDDMVKASERLDFERAAILRDRILGLKKITEKQKIIVPGGGDKDIIAVSSSESAANAQVFIIREGRLSGREQLWFEGIMYDNDAEILDEFIKQYYVGADFIPKEIFIQMLPEDNDMLCGWLSEKRGSKVEIKVPHRGNTRELMEMAKKNAQQAMDEYIFKTASDKSRTLGALRDLENVLGLYGKLSRIEAYDISNTAGSLQVGCMAVFEDGMPANGEYRNFKIKSDNGRDDYGAMREVVARRLKRAIDERDTNEQNQKFARLPGLILADGGMGHAGVVKAVVDEFGMNIAVLGMVKDQSHRTRALITADGEIIGGLTPEAFRLIATIQEEVHRIAIGYHRKLRQKEGIHSELDKIPFIGESRRKSLLKELRTISAIKTASIDELAKVKGMTHSSAEAVFTYFHK